MKLSKETIALLKNFATINGNLLIKPGSNLSTISASKSVYATVDVTEDFPSQFGIYDLNEFLGVIALFNDPELNFTDKYVSIKEGRNSVKYFGADETVLVAPSKALKVPPADIEFNLTTEQVNMVLRTSGVLRAPDVTISGDGEVLKIIVGDRKNSSGNNYVMEVGETDSVFNANIRVDNIKMIPGDYKVELAAKKIAKFSNGSLQYVLSLEADSTFQD